jgi:dTDP-D-glucose 4,6-dehydratase
VPVELAVASIIAFGGVLTAVVAGVFGFITARSSRAVSDNTDEIAAVTAQALKLVDHYKALAERAEARLATKDRTITDQRETIDRLLERQDILRRAAEK